MTGKQGRASYAIVPEDSYWVEIIETFPGHRPFAVGRVSSQFTDLMQEVADRLNVRALAAPAPELECRLMLLDTRCDCAGSNLSHPVRGVTR